MGSPSVTQDIQRPEEIPAAAGVPNPAHYDPTNPVPYQPVNLPEPAVPKPQPFESNVSPAVARNPPSSTLGGIAAGLDSIFRGYMNGKAQGEAQKIMKAKAQTDNLQAAYNMAAQNYKQVYEANGGDPNNPDVKQAKAAVDGTWGALTDYYGSHITTDDGAKKKKSTKKQDQPGSPITQLQSQDPNEKMQGYYAVMKKVGPPVYHQLPSQGAIKAGAEREQVTQQTQDIEAQNKLHKDKLQQQLNTLNDEERMSSKPLSPEKQAVRKSLEADLAGTPKVKEPTNAFEAAYQAKKKEVGRDLTTEEVGEIASSMSKDPSSAFALAASAKKKELGRPLTEKEVLDVFKATKEADPFAGMRNYLAQQRFDEVKNKQVEKLMGDADNQRKSAQDKINQRIDNLNKEVDAGHLDRDSDDYKKRMKQIETDDYTNKVAIGSQLAGRLQKEGVNVAPPKPDPWEQSNLTDAERNKILGGGEAAAPKDTGGGNEMVDVQIPGQKPGHIPRSKLDDFKRKHPDAQVL